MDPRGIAAELAKTEMFGVLTEEERLHIAGAAQYRRLVKNQTLFVKDEPGNSLYVLIEGRMRILVHSRQGDVMELGRIEPHTVFGEVAALGRGLRTASVEVVEPSAVIGLRRDDLMPLLQSNQAFLDAVLSALCRLINRADGQITDHYFLDLKALVAKKLLELAEPDASGQLVTRPVTQADMARMVGGTRQSVNQNLRTFENRGWIRTIGRRYQILKPKELGRLTEQ